jgi:hypothetical protein
VLGYDPEMFWDQTPHTLSLAFEAANENLRMAHNDRAWLAWHIAGLQRVKRIPTLTSLQVARRPMAQPKLDEQIEGLKNWVRATGGKIIYTQ